jgi:hypothetical protein
LRLSIKSCCQIIIENKEINEKIKKGLNILSFLLLFLFELRLSEAYVRKTEVCFLLGC